MDPDDRRGAGRVECHGRAVQIQKIRDSIRCDAERATGIRVGVRALRSDQRRIVVARDANELAGVGSGDPVERNRGVLERFPGEFEQQPLLRIDLPRFPGREREELVIEAVDAAEQTTRACIHPLRPGRIRMIVAQIPTIARLGNAIDAGFEVLPQLGGCVRAAGLAPAKTDDGYAALCRTRLCTAHG